MPKKTLKQKILTAQRHSTPSHPPSFSYQLPTLKGRQASTVPITPYIKTDIIKTVILGTLFIALQVGISFLIKSKGW